MPPRRVSRRGVFFGPCPMNSPLLAVLSPCIGICSLDGQGLCEGCHRTTSEIARWSQMSDAERLHVMDAVLPVREANRV
jgi:predicted Fe-S protein YdhL (DUF1289 family)